MNTCRPDSKLEARLCPVLHFFGDFYEILSIYFIARQSRRRSFQNDFVKGMELSFVLHRASDEARFDSRIPLRASSIAPARSRGIESPTFAVVAIRCV
jgi:hypothetical protein